MGRSRPAGTSSPFREGLRYVAAVDPREGGQDAFTLAIAHAEGTSPDRRIVQEVMRGWASRRSETTDGPGDHGHRQAVRALDRRGAIGTQRGDIFLVNDPTSAARS
jgi:hypothetical protein